MPFSSCITRKSDDTLYDFTNFFIKIHLILNKIRRLNVYMNIK